MATDLLLHLEPHKSITLTFDGSSDPDVSIDDPPKFINVVFDNTNDIGANAQNTNG